MMNCDVPMRAYDFVQKFGVNCNLNAGDLIPNIIADLSYLGIYNIRDHIWGGSNYPNAAAFPPYFSYFAGLGIKARAHFGYQGTIQGGNSYPMANWTSELKGNIALPYCGQIVGVAGPNEPDNAANNGGFLYTDGTGGATAALAIPAATTAQQALYNAMKADEVLLRIPVDEWPSAFAYSGNFAGTFNNRVSLNAMTERQNLHAYFSADMTNQPTFPANGPIYTALNDPSNGYLVNDHAFCSHAKRFITTETGWDTPWASGGQLFSSIADDRAKARLILCSLFDHASQPNCEAVYIYTLRFGQSHFAIMNNDGSPKPAAYALANAVAILKDGPATCPDLVLNYQLSGMPTQSGNVALQKNDGSFFILLWNETSFFNASTGADIAITTSNVTITLPRPMSGLIYDPCQARAPLVRFGKTSSLVVALNDSPLIIALG